MSVPSWWMRQQTRGSVITAGDISGAIDSVQALTVTLDFIKCGGFGNSLGVPFASRLPE